MAKKINCIWRQAQRLLVNPDGQVLPCCYLANSYYTTTTLLDQHKDNSVYEGHRAQLMHPVMQEYHNNREKFNVFSTPMDEILKSDWFTKTLPESWDSDSTVHIQCKRMCEVDV